MELTTPTLGPHPHKLRHRTYPYTHPHASFFASLQSLGRKVSVIVALFCLTSLSFAAQIPPQTPPNNSTLDFGAVLTGQPSIQWNKITQSSPSASVVITSFPTGTPYLATLVEDTGFGHGQPPASAFSPNPTGSCLNCWLGIRFTPTTTGLATATLTLTPSPIGSPYTLSLTGTGLPVTGLLLTPITHDFGSIPIHSVSPPALFTVTNLNPTGTSINLSNPTFSGYFTSNSTPTGGPVCGGPLAYTSSCFLQIAFAPTATGPLTGTLNLQAGNLTASAQLTGSGTPDPGLTLNPTALTFNNVPGATATQQTIIVSNTSSTPEQIAPPTLNSPAFTASSNCSFLLASTTCTLTVTFTPTTSPQIATLTLSVISAGNITLYTIPITGNYTTQTAGLQILPNDTQFGPQPLSTLSTPRQYILNNLTAKSLDLTYSFPRQFALTGTPCATLAPFATCTFSAALVPLTNADTTGTLFVTGIPTDGSPNLTGIAYFEGYGATSANTSLSITDPALQSDDSLNFGQLPSGQTSTPPTLTLANASTLPITIHRITSPWPFAATSNCLLPLASTTTCTITLTYAPLNQVPLGSAPAPTTTDISTLLIESDAASSPNLIHLTGSSTPAVVSAPANEPLQAILTTSQSSLTFTSVAGATSAPQTVTLTNTGTTPLTLSIAPPPEFPLTHNCTTLAPSISCILNISFSPLSTTSINNIASIEISSNASTPLEFISLLGIVVPAPPPTPTFTLTANPTSSTVAAGSTATYPLTATPRNGFTGPIALTCTPIAPAPFATCTIQPPSLTLTSTPQTAIATITTVAATAQLTPHTRIPGAGTIVTCLLLPTFLFAFTKSRRIPIAWVFLVTATLLTLSGCGNIITPYLTPAIRQPGTPTGTYTYQVTATSTSAPTPITQTVTLTLTVR